MPNFVVVMTSCNARFRVWQETKEMVRNALGQLLPASATVPLKKSHEAKLHSRETVLGDDLPRPRLPKSLRQLYGNSADAESRTMAFFHRVNEVDTFLNELEFQDCSYCHEGWFGTKRTKAQLPGKFETQTYQKTNFVQMPKKDWLEPERPICDMCLKEAKKRGARRVQCEVWSVECEESNEKWEVWSVDCEVWSVECEVWIGESAVWSEKCEVLTAKGAVWSVKTVKCEVWRGASSVTCETRHQFRRVHARTGLAGARRMQVL